MEIICNDCNQAIILESNGVEETYTCFSYTYKIAIIKKTKNSSTFKIFLNKTLDNGNIIYKYSPTTIKHLLKAIELCTGLQFSDIEKLEMFINANHDIILEEF